jgi:peptidoglycan hydrolase-like protein with peptidoglycan-binding domain
LSDHLANRYAFSYVAIVSPGPSTGSKLLSDPGRPRRRLRPAYVILAGLLVLLGVVAVALVMLGTSKPSLVADQHALARIEMPFGGGTVQSVIAVTGPNDRRIPVVLRDNVVWPQKKIWAGRKITIWAVVKRPGWVSWLTGKQQRLQLTVTTPQATLAHTYVTLARHAPLRVSFNRPVSVVSYGPSRSKMVRHVLPSPTSEVTLPRTAAAGSIWILGVPLGWETTQSQVLSWFPGGAATAAVASPAPGTTIKPTTPIALTFSKPVARALDHGLPPVPANTQGAWHQTGSHSIVFQPTGYGYGLGATVKVVLPGSVRLVGGTDPPATDVGTWKVPPGSTLRLQQLLASLGYLPLSFQGPSVAATATAQEAAAVTPPSGSFSWRYGNIPSALQNIWQAGASGVMTQGAVMAFENDHGLATVGLSNPLLWRYLIQAQLAHHVSTFGYTFVQVSEGSPETEHTWHNGRTVVSGLVNTGIPAAPTAQGIFPVFEHALSVTMSGTNPDGSHYSDPGVPYTSYFNGGDALHGFIRASYGFPQSLGCVEMPYSEAGAVYPYTPIGTLVDVS